MAARHPEPIASSRHSWILTGILLLVAAFGLLALHRSAGAPTAPAGAITYVWLIVAEWALFLYVRAGVNRRGTAIRSLVSDRSPSSAAIAVDLLLGLVLLALLLGADYLVSKAVGPGNQKLVRSLLVHDPALVPLWLLLSASAGFVEELTFRGYFQRQYSAWLGNPWLGLVAQAVLFGVTHGYQGPVQILKITVLGAIFGAAALLRRSVVPGIFAHIALDVAGGLALLR